MVISREVEEMCVVKQGVHHGAAPIPEEAKWVQAKEVKDISGFTLQKGPRYLEMAEGYVTGIALDAEDQIIGYQFVSLGKMTDFIKKGDDPNTAWEKAKGQYGRVADAVKIIDPRKE